MQLIDIGVNLTNASFAAERQRSCNAPMLPASPNWC